MHWRRPIWIYYVPQTTRTISHNILHSKIKIIRNEIEHLQYLSMSEYLCVMPPESHLLFLIQLAHGDPQILMTRNIKKRTHTKIETRGKKKRNGRRRS